MKSPLFIIMFLVVVLSASGCSEKSNTTASPKQTVGLVEWTNSATVYSVANDGKKYSMLFIGATWCTYCNLMKNSTFNDSTIAGILNDNFNSILIETDIDSLVAFEDDFINGYNFGLQYGVRAYPTFVFLDSSANQIERVVGYKNSSEFLIILNSIIE